MNVLEDSIEVVATKAADCASVDGYVADDTTVKRTCVTKREERKCRKRSEGDVDKEGKMVSVTHESSRELVHRRRSATYG